MNFKLLKQPRLTEKTWTQKEMGNQITFMVDVGANKIEIKKTVEDIFKVTVLGVNTINMQGKVKRMGRFVGRRPAWKKAIVTLKEGDRIEYFEGA
ncbi:MAG: 50S ribosomal protein L23 [SAR324 cluster bacterium]|nr:50S ribosomal protein L23 [SAR324 cluster bacterium]MCZ6532522.1 50S ribosomal protein L23 [SAR324 cluster bacterium]MCZ6558882.1 50S ribosomal protein L23 [SAR324 cluster bacterium]MCZ6627081.1 50S ribosomal protein L23 [SAR324 cluster bacterium]MCZ6646372.1 50S ribosomal protein L23 [SAR324 cluster bacterium]